MKRTNVIIDEELLEKARVATGERTYSATINTALERVVRQREFWAAYDRFEEEASKGDFFWPGYLREIRPNAYTDTPRRTRRSAHEKRASPAKAKPRGSR